MCKTKKLTSGALKTSTWVVGNGLLHRISPISNFSASGRALAEPEFDMSPPLTPDLRAQAARWLVSVMDPKLDTAPEAMRVSLLTAFHAWLSKSPQHLEALRDALETFPKNGRLDLERSDDLRQILNEAPNNVIAFPRRQPHGAHIVPDADRPPRYLPQPRRPWAATCSTIVLLVLIVASAVAYRGLAQPTPKVYMTRVGEHRQVVLSEALTVDLNTNTKAEVKASAHEGRDIRLVRGEALFDVQHHERGSRGSALRVFVGSYRLRDVGTRFSVFLHENGTATVSVYEGLVEVSSSRPGANAPNILHAGDVVELPASGLAPNRTRHVPVKELESKLSWIEGTLSLTGETLTEVAAEFNRYNRKQLVVIDPRIADLSMGGTFVATDPDSFVEAIRRYLPIKVLPPDAAHPDPNVIRLGSKSK
jgi:transmembrane sensor